MIDKKIEILLDLAEGIAPDGFTLEPDGTLRMDESVDVGDPRWYELDRLRLEIEGWPDAEIDRKHRRIREEIAEMDRPTRPPRYADDPDLVRIVNAAWHDIADANTPPQLFIYGGKPVRIVDVNGFDTIDILDRFKLQLESARASFWITRGRSEEKPARPPMSIISSMLGQANIPLPPFTGIVTTPVFSSAGKLIIKPGYDAGARLYYSPGTLKIKPIPQNPTAADVAAAKAILEEMLRDFPFVSSADRAHAWAAFFLIPCRELIDGPTPITLFESPEAGTGKGLLCESILHAFTNGNFERFSPTTDDQETRKRITSVLLATKPAMLLDNVNDLSGPALASATTTRFWSDRYLGKNEIITMPVRLQFVATGNNVTLSGELARRIVRCRMEAATDRPWLRDGFKIENLPQWVRDHRANIIEAVLTLAQSWITAGMPPPKVKPLGSYDAWTRVVGGILEFIGIEGFLGNIIEVYEKSDITGNATRALVAEWWERHSTLEVQARDLFDIARTIDGLPLYGRTEDSQARSFARFLQKQRQRIFTIETDGEAVKLQVADAGKIKRIQVWKLAVIGDEKAAGTLNFSPEGADMEELL